jgi:hypothetical protein
MTAEQFMDFINKEQRDPRLNEILYPYTTTEKSRELIDTYEPSGVLRAKNLLSVEGFLRYILSDDNAIVAPEKYDLSDDMDQPMGHYFINSSHNTYLTGATLLIVTLCKWFWINRCCFKYGSCWFRSSINWKEFRGDVQTVSTRRMSLC